MQIVEVNIVAALVATVVAFVVGGLWYSPLLFGKMWMKEMKATDADIKKAKEKGMAKEYALQFVGTFLTAYVFAHVLAYAEAVHVNEALQGAFWMWLGFIVPLQIAAIAWTKKSWTWFAIDGGHYLVSLLAMAVVLTWMS